MACQLVARAVEKGATGRGEHQPAHLARRAAAQRLMERDVLAVDREQSRALPGGKLGEQPARHHQRFLVGEREILAGGERGMGGSQARRADHRREDAARLGVGRRLEKSLGSAHQPTPAGRRGATFAAASLFMTATRRGRNSRAWAASASGSLP